MAPLIQCWSALCTLHPVLLVQLQASVELCRLEKMSSSAEALGKLDQKVWRLNWSSRDSLDFGDLKFADRSKELKD